jgi:hypothetical protein
MSPLLFSVFPRLLDQNESARLMWHTYCHSEKVEVGTFLEAVTLFMREQLHIPLHEIEAILTEANKAALVVGVDSDGSGKVRFGTSAGGHQGPVASAAPVTRNRNVNGAGVRHGGEDCVQRSRAAFP